MTRIDARWLTLVLLLVTATYAIAEDITLTTYYPSPRGVYAQLRVGAGTPGATSADLYVMKPTDTAPATFAFRVDDAPNPDTTPFVINQDGKVLIGLTAPFPPNTIGSALDAHDAILQTGVQAGGLSVGKAGIQAEYLTAATPNNGCNAGRIQLWDTSENRGWQWANAQTGCGGVNDALRLNFFTGAGWINSIMTVLGNGNVGIGTAAPTWPQLQIQGPVGSSFAAIGSGVGAAFPEPHVELRGDSGSWPRIDFLSAASPATPHAVAGDRQDYDARLYYHTPTDTLTVTAAKFLVQNRIADGAAPWLAIAAGGNVGIGTVTPGTKLDVDGTVTAPLFSDRDNPVFYLDPNAISVLHDIRPSIVHDRNDPTFYLDPASSSNLNNVFASIFYDRNKPVFYLDPDNFSELSFVRVNQITATNGLFSNGQIGVFGGGQISTSGVIIGGSLVITGAKTFVIDHPLKPGYQLAHASLEGPEAGVYYRGRAQLSHGKVQIILPDYFDALTRDHTETILLTPKGEVPFLLSYDHFDETSFVVFGTIPDGAFDWELKAVRGDIPPLEVERKHEETPGPAEQGVQGANRSRCAPGTQGAGCVG